MTDENRRRLRTLREWLTLIASAGVVAAGIVSLMVRQFDLVTVPVQAEALGTLRAERDSLLAPIREELTELKIDAAERQSLLRYLGCVDRYGRRLQVDPAGCDSHLPPELLETIRPPSVSVLK